ncbi:MAG: CRTAC1 family protein [Acidimicrobiales bacterium]|nr:CRTAC1 family protein [Acidimicrobiales bacterium]
MAWRRPRRALGAAVVACLLALPACVGSSGDGGGPAPGADVDRPAQPSADLVRLTDVAGEVGLDFRHGAFRWGLTSDPVSMTAGGLCWIDYDRDGWLDLFVVNLWSEREWGQWRREGGLPETALFRNDGGTFVDVTDDAGAGLAIRGTGCVAADLDLDGWTDLYVTTERENVLLWNEGGDAFEEGAAAAGVDGYGWHAGVAVGDVDGNGWPDVFVAGYVNRNGRNPDAGRAFPANFLAEPDLLYLNLGPGDDDRPRFREVGEAVGLEPDGAEYGLGAVFSDVDGDGDLDLFVANETNPNRLYVNEPDGDAGGLGFRLDERAVEAGVGDPTSAMGVAAGDEDADGSVDLLVTNIDGERHSLYRNQSGAGGLAFVDAVATGEAGVPDLGLDVTGWGASWADLDLDTDLDLVVASGALPIVDLEADREPVEAFENRTAQGEAGRLAPLGAGLDALGPIQGRGLAAADYDNDGDLDVAIVAIAGELVLLRNTGAGGHWLEVALEEFAPGATVTVVLPDGTELVREIRAGGSFLSSEDPRAHVGLGTATQVDEVRVRWPDGETTTVADVEADRILSVGRD